MQHAAEGVWRGRQGQRRARRYMSLRRPLTALAVSGLLLTAGHDMLAERRQLEARALAEGDRTAS